MRVPFLVRWPGRMEARQDELLLSTVDIYPTLLDLMGLGGEIPGEVQGTSYAGLFLGDQMERPLSQLYLWMPYDRPTLGRRGLRTERYTYVENRMPGEPASCELYDRIEDPYQMVELSAQRLDVVRELSEQLVHRLGEAGAHWTPTFPEAVLQ